MSNTFFKFKQFTVHQSQCAMKVCTDACLFGSLLPSSNKPHSVLDIGTGTGLLSLMYAQRNPHAEIGAIEIDLHAALQAESNFKNSPFASQISLLNADVKHYAEKSKKKYDVIICNPPFYENQLQSYELKKSVAHHSTALTLNNLAKIANDLINEHGTFAILLPYYRSDYFTDVMQKHSFYSTKVYFIKQTVQRNPFRAVVFFTKENMPLQQEVIVIKDTNDRYTETFLRLLKDYYLHL